MKRLVLIPASLLAVFAGHEAFKHRSGTHPAPDGFEETRAAPPAPRVHPNLKAATQPSSPAVPPLETQNRRRISLDEALEQLDRKIAAMEQDVRANRVHEILAAKGTSDEERRLLMGQLDRLNDLRFKRIDLTFTRAEKRLQALK